MTENTTVRTENTVDATQAMLVQLAEQVAKLTAQVAAQQSQPAQRGSRSANYGLKHTAVLGKYSVTEFCCWMGANGFNMAQMHLALYDLGYKVVSCDTGVVDEVSIHTLKTQHQLGRHGAPNAYKIQSEDANTLLDLKVPAGKYVKVPNGPYVKV